MSSEGERMPGRLANIVLIGSLVMFVTGCHREDYRRRADNQTYDIIKERLLNPRWNLPPRPVEAAPTSRMADLHDPDHEPIPPDDPASRIFQVSNGQPFEFHGWKKRGVADIEDYRWLSTMPFDNQGEVILSRESSLQLAMTNSRDYQFQVENVYLTALTLTLARFQFQIQPFARQQSFFNRIGGGKTARDKLTLNGQDGLNLNLLSGGQLLVNFTNSLVFDFTGHGIQTSNSGLAVSLTQPLLRGAFLRIATQALSNQERNTLYTIRNFARFRRAFYVGIAGGQGYLGLLSQLQGIRNTEENLNSLRRSLQEIEELVKANLASLAQRDTTAQQLQLTEFQLVQSRASLETSLDQFKIQLGLPPTLPVKLDDGPLKVFELNDTRSDTLRQSNEKLYLSLLQTDVPPSKEELKRVLGQLREDYIVLEQVLVGAEQELLKWQTRIGLIDSTGLPVALPDSSNPIIARQIELAGRLGPTLEGVRNEVDDNRPAVDALLAQIEAGGASDETWLKAKTLVGKEFRTRLSDVYVSQAQIRVFLIDLQPVDLTVEEAISIAFENRQDLMNARGAVTDSWRNVEFDANRLQAGLNLVYNGNLGTSPKHEEILGFNAHYGNHQVGLQFDAPLVRLAERNVYRSDQINFQRNRRAYMLTSDTILQQIRLDMRQLALFRRQFEINRDQIITAARQVEENEYTIRTTREKDASTTILLLQALNNLLSAKNTLIGSWVSYETSRMSLYRDFDIMDVDAQGVWTNEFFDPAIARRILERMAPGQPNNTQPTPPSDPDMVGPGDPTG